MEIKLNDNSRVIMKWINPDTLTVEVSRPMNRHDGHGWWVSGTALLDAGELIQFLTESRERLNNEEKVQ